MTGSKPETTRPARGPFWRSVLLNVLLGRPFYILMHGPDGEWTEFWTDSFAQARYLHRYYRSIGCR